MANSIVDAQSVLVIDLGSVNTRALLFDIVEGEYHFIAVGNSTTTLEAPFRDVREGIHLAILKLQEITGRIFVGEDTQLILPAQPNGSGVDRLALVFTAGPELHIVAVGLLNEVSMESLQRLAGAAYGRVVESVGLNDRRRMETQLDAIVRSGPDLLLLAGGTDGGASRSVVRQVELVNLVCRILPNDRRPEILYVGNQVLAAKIKEILDKFASTSIAPNIRPSIDVEDINPAMGALSQVLTRLRTRKLGGMDTYLSSLSTPALPATAGMGHIIRFLSGIYDPKTVLAVDVGASWTTLVTAQHGALSTNVFPYGMGSGITNLLQQTRIEEIAQWLPIHIPTSVVRDYLWQKALYPASIPMSIEALAIEQALARQNIRAALQGTLARWPNLNMAFEPILASGGILTSGSTPAQALLILLDGLQPAGITLAALDQNGVLPALGAISTFNSILPVQVIESGALLNLATVIAPISNEKYGTPVLSVQMEYENGSNSTHQITQGSLTALPLSPGQKARVHLKPLRRLELNPYGGQRMTSFNATGGVCGLVIDCRGRPLQLPKDEARRRDMIRKWLTALGNLPPAQ
jgi:hypothetical protein